MSQEMKKFNILLKASTVFDSETHLRRTILKDRLTTVCQRGQKAYLEKNINLKFR